MPGQYMSHFLEQDAEIGEIQLSSEMEKIFQERKQQALALARNFDRENILEYSTSLFTTGMGCSAKAAVRDFQVLFHKVFRALLANRGM